MSEKRYYIFLDDVWCIRDRTNKRNTWRVGKNKGFANNICKTMNKQQSNICKLQDLCGESDSENAKLRIENKKLQEMDEQLREINKEIGDDLYNCRLNKNIISEKLRLWQDVHKEHNIYSIKDFEELMKKVK